MAYGYDEPVPPGDPGGPPPDPPPGTPPTPPPSTPPTPPGGNERIPLGTLKITQALLDALHSGYKIQGNELVWNGDPQYKSNKTPEQILADLHRIADPLAAKDWRGFFNQISGSNNPNQMNPLEDPYWVNVLKVAGFNIAPANAAGETRKIQTPDGRWVRVLDHKDPVKGYGDWTWVEDGGGAPPGGSWWDQIPAPDPYTAPDRPEWLQGPFTPPTQQELENSSGYAARMAAAQKGFERGAAAKGSILSGGTQVALSREMQNQASGEYSNLFGQRLLGRQANEGAFQSDVSNKLNQYKQRYQAYQDAIANLYKYA